MEKNMYDKKRYLKPEYYMTDDQKRKQQLTDYGKGIYYKSVDGGEYTSMDDVEKADRRYFEETTRKGPRK